MSTNNPLGIKLVDLTPAVVQELRGQQERQMSIIDNLRTNAAVDRLGPGDVLAITIYEAGNGLFSPRKATSDTDAAPTGSTAENLPRLQVDRNGLIMVPYAGEIRVAGHTTTEVQRIIEDRLRDKTAQAQVLVSLVTNGSNIVYISGDVKASGRYPLSLAHERLLDIVALAGGPTHSPQDTLVKVDRHGQEATTSLTRVQTIPAENIAIEPQDRIQVDYLPRSYLSFGATGRVAQVQFDAATVSLAEAVARVGGLNDDRANPEAVFLFRYERPANAAALGVLPPGAPTSAAPAVPGTAPTGTPVIYKVNMREPQTFFAIQQFPMQDKDVIYIANAPTVQIYKFLQLIYTFATPAITARAVVQ
ncbi:polysaccharide biosynthesis/export family protein [Acidisphaera sp. L21]|uniref:polysaccharide biosynthesis/export family protein n=1 Tax=Acidisphaera sp. L21 TaxID=1641851 RepID=UPI00131D1A44|nr:polysaccharide biosynthesis/export family protein [Acidisphaera sp. L21]